MINPARRSRNAGTASLSWWWGRSRLPWEPGKHSPPEPRGCSIFSSWWRIQQTSQMPGVPGILTKQAAQRLPDAFYDPTVPSFTWECGALGHSRGIELWLGFCSREKSGGSRSSDSGAQAPEPSQQRVSLPWASLHSSVPHKGTQTFPGTPSTGLGLDQVSEEPLARGWRAESNG